MLSPASTLSFCCWRSWDLGAIIEMVEYGVVLTFETNGVGDYDNNMQDLLANFCGSLIYLALRAGLGGVTSLIPADRPKGR